MSSDLNEVEPQYRQQIFDSYFWLRKESLIEFDPSWVFLGAENNVRRWKNENKDSMLKSSVLIHSPLQVILEQINQPIRWDKNLKESQSFEKLNKQISLNLSVYKNNSWYRRYFCFFLFYNLFF